MQGADSHSAMSARCRTLLFLFLVLMDVADFISDWLFYADVKMAAPGLVYGPVDPDIVRALLAFSIIGSVAFVLEVVNLWLEMYRDKALVDSDLLSALVVWVEDVPQIVISFRLALCREEAISVFQLTKAGVVILGVLVRVVMACVKYCNKEARRSHRHGFYKAAIFLGILTEAVFAGLVFFLVNTKPSESGSPMFRVPQTLIREQFDHEHYFAGVGIFVHQRGLFNKLGNDDPRDLEVVNWMRAAWLDDIREKGAVHFKYEYQDQSPNTFNLAVWQKSANYRNAAWSLSGCYTVVKGNGTIVDHSSSSREAWCETSSFMDNPASLVFTFQFTPPAAIMKQRVFGHVAFNVKMKADRNAPCQSPGPLLGVADDIREERRDDQNAAELTLHFYRTVANHAPTTVQDRTLNHRAGQAPTFYRNDEDDGDGSLADVKKIWKTGWMECAMTGYVGPPLDDDIDVPCA